MSRTLHFNFAEDQTLQARDGGPLVSFNRTSEATNRNSAGLLEVLAGNTARHDHDKDGVAIGFLVEKAKTNIITNSADFSAGAWAEGGSAATVVGNEATAPDGTMSADLLIDDGAEVAPDTVRTGQNVTGIATATTYIFSCYAKAGGLDWVRFRIINMAAQTLSAYYDLTNIAVGASPGADVVAARITDEGNGWRRLELELLTDAVDTVADFRIGVAEGDEDDVVDDDGTSSIYLWGAQLEASKFLTSYIPTVASSVTRTNDTPAPNTTMDWFDGGPFTLFVHSKVLPNSKGLGEKVPIYIAATSAVYTRFNNGSGAQVSIGTSCVLSGSAPAADESRGMYALDTNDAIQYLDGAANGTDVACAYSVAVVSFYLGKTSGTSYFDGHLIEIAAWDERLANDILEDYTENGLPAGTRNFIALTRRTASQMRPKQRMPKPRATTRGFFE